MADNKIIFIGDTGYFCVQLFSKKFPDQKQPFDMSAATLVQAALNNGSITSPARNGDIATCTDTTPADWTLSLVAVKVSDLGTPTAGKKNSMDIRITLGGNIDTWRVDDIDVAGDVFA